MGFIVYNHHGCSADCHNLPPLVIGPITHTLSKFKPALIHLCVSPCCNTSTGNCDPATYSMDKVPARPSTHSLLGEQWLMESQLRSSPGSPESLAHHLEFLPFSPTRRSWCCQLLILSYTVTPPSVSFTHHTHFSTY